jgi:signal transduction histidine kinase
MTGGWRLANPTVRSGLLDVFLAAVPAVMIEILAYDTTFFGDRIAGKSWAICLWPILVCLPLCWRRTRPLPVMAVVGVGICLQAVLSGSTPDGLEMIWIFCVAAYSVAAYTVRREAVAGLAILVATYGVYTLQNAGFRNGVVGDQWAIAFFAAFFSAAWLIGAWIRSRREAAAAALHAADLERRTAEALADERARVARELHDIVSHNLSVVVLQASGARAQPERDSAAVQDTLEKIESSSREALVEMRRMLGVLRTADGEVADLSPQPGMSELAALADGVRRAGLPVELTVEGDMATIPPAVALSAFRIVQEGLTNALRHAGPARAWVSVRNDGTDVTVDVVDDGRGTGDGASAGAGQGLIGMRERVGLLGGSLDAGPGATGGFAVRARLPVSGGQA